MNDSVLIPVVAFPNVYWWRQFAHSTVVLLDYAEHFRKMSFRNRYLIAGPDGVVTLSVPVAEGRQQRRSMGSVRTDARDKWQIRQWRTLQSTYNRSPYFEFYAHQLEPLFSRPYELLVDFNRDSIEIVAQLLGLRPEIRTVTEYTPVPADGVLDLRNEFLCKAYEAKLEPTKPYHQVFSDRTGFLPNLSILDLLFNEGPAARGYLQ